MSLHERWIEMPRCGTTLHRVHAFHTIVSTTQSVHTAKKLEARTHTASPTTHTPAPPSAIEVVVHEAAHHVWHHAHRVHTHGHTHGHPAHRQAPAHHASSTHVVHHTTAEVVRPATAHRAVHTVRHCRLLWRLLLWTIITGGRF